MEMIPVLRHFLGIVQVCNDGLRTGRPEFDSRLDQEVFYVSAATRLDVGLTEPFIQWIPETHGVGLPGWKMSSPKAHNHLGASHNNSST
jgi:hypothetical protein